MMMTFWKSFRLILIYTLVLLLGFEPAAMAIGAARIKRVEVALMQSEMTKRQVTLKEFLDVWGDVLPPALKLAAHQVVAMDPNYRLPKLNVQKVKGTNGETNLQLNFTDKVAGSASMFIEEVQGNVQMKWGGETFKVQDWANAGQFMAKVAKASKADPKDLPFWVKDPNFARQLQFYSKAQYSKLKAPKQKKYNKALVELLAAIEKVQSAQARTQEVLKSKPKPKKTAWLEFQLWWSALVQDAEADGQAEISVDDPCIAAGRIARWGKQPSGRFTCGGAQQAELLCADGSGLKCDEDLFGPGLCAPNSFPKVATLVCAEKEGSKFKNFATLAPAEQASIRQQLDRIDAGPCSSANLEAVKATELSKYPSSNIHQDQELACIGLAEARTQFIEVAPAPQAEPTAPVEPSTAPPSATPAGPPAPNEPAPEVVVQPPAIAPDSISPCVEVAPSAPPAAAPVSPVVSGEQNGETGNGRSNPPIVYQPAGPMGPVCSDIDEQRVEEEIPRLSRTPACQEVERNGNVRVSVAASAAWNCINPLDTERLERNPDGYCSEGGARGRKVPYYFCECPQGQTAEVKYKTASGNASVSCPSLSGERDSGRDKKPGFFGKIGNWFKKNGKWVTMFLGGLLALWLYDRMYKKSLEENFRINFPPTTTLPPAPAPPPPPPTPRT